MITDWDKRCVLITGGSRGIGEAIAHRFARLGCCVIATSQSEQGCLIIEEKAKAQGLTIYTAVLKTDCPESREAFFSEIKQRGFEIDTLINNAGKTDDQIAFRMKKQGWDSVIETNLSGPFFITQELMKGMIKKRFGRIINIGSVVASTGNPGQANYCASKAGLIGLSKALALEIGSRGITVNVIAPGFIETEMTAQLSDQQRQSYLSKIPAARFGSAEDIANACSFLASDESSYINGQVLHINGGLYCSD